MQVRDVLDEVRNIVQDTVSEYRYPDAMLVGYANQAMNRMAVARPDLFAAFADCECKTGSVEIRAPGDSIRIIELHASTNESQMVRHLALTEVSLQTLNASDPSWRSAEPAPACQFARNVRNPNVCFITPPAPENQTVRIEYAWAHPRFEVADITSDTKAKGIAPEADDTLIAADEIELLPDSFFPVMVDGIVALVESMEDESVNSGRAQIFWDSFHRALGVAAQSRVLTDTMRGGLPVGQVAEGPAR